jgi:hypothetical protein
LEPIAPAKIKIQAGTATPANNAAPRKNGLKPKEKNAGPSYGGKDGSSSDWAPAGWLTRISIGFAATRVILDAGRSVVNQRELKNEPPFARFDEHIN